MNRRPMLLTASLLMLIAAFGDDARASAEGGLWLEGNEIDGRPTALALATDVRIEATGLVASARVHQQFFNQTGHWAEGHYRFPLPDGAAVERLEIRVGERLIAGEIRDREAARADYEAARDSGRVAGLVERSPGHFFTTRVANVPPGEAVEIRIGFSLPVRFEHGRFELAFPTTSAPRFNRADEMTRAARSRLLERSGTALPERPFRLAVDIRPGMPLAEVTSSHHAIDVERRGEQWQVSLSEGFDLSGRDFELAWRPEPPATASSAAFAEAVGGHEHLMLMLVPPRRFEAESTPREMTLVIDTSGSMENEPIEQARESLLHALAGLRSGDRFNVIAFDQQARALHRRPVAFDEARLIEASRWVERLAAGGGTDMGPPLELALSSPASDGFLRQIVFITDGMVPDEAGILQRVRDADGETRLFTVGIGHGVNGTFLRGLARAGRGTYTAIADVEQIVERMSELVLQLQSPVVHDLKLHLPVDAEVFPQRLPDLYVGQPLVITARMEALSGDVLLTGTSNGEPFEMRRPLEAFREAPGVAAQWGRARIDWLEGMSMAAEDRRAVDRAILETALEYRLVSSQTSLVAVDRRPERSREAALERYGLETSPAHGRSAAMHVLPATDAGSAPMLVRGVVALLLVVLLFLPGLRAGVEATR
jgi:Ca-activated chloride channel family protein